MLRVMAIYTRSIYYEAQPKIQIPMILIIGLLSSIRPILFAYCLYFCGALIKNFRLHFIPILL